MNDKALLLELLLSSLFALACFKARAAKLCEGLLHHGQPSHHSPSKCTPSQANDSGSSHNKFRKPQHTVHANCTR